MEWLNYHHLLYFWTVVRAGSIHQASRDLRISAPSISTQLKQLEEQLGEKLLTRSGRRLVLTEIGRTVFSYADDIFTLGREMVDVVRNRPVGRPLRLDIGIVDVMPKIVVQALLEPALRLQQQVRIVCREASSDQLLGRLATHELDVVLSDSPVDPTLKIRAYSHLLGECGVVFVAVAKHGERYRRVFQNRWIRPLCFSPPTTRPFGATLISGLIPTVSCPRFWANLKIMPSYRLSAKPAPGYFQCQLFSRTRSAGVNT